MAGSGTIDLNGFNLNVSSLATQLLSGGNGGVPITASNSGNISNAGTALSTITVNGSASTTYQGLIGAGTYVNPGGASGTDNIKLVLASANTGTLTLTGPNTYNQGTDIEGGTLVIDTYQYTNNLTPPTVTYGSSLPANSNVTNNSNAAFGLVINDGPTVTFPVTNPPSPPNNSTGTAANQIIGTGNTEISSTGLLTVGTLNQGSVANQGTLTINTAGTITHGINNTIGATSTGGSTTIAAGASVTVGNVIQNLLTVNGKLAITATATGTFHVPSSTSVVSTLSFGGSGLLDVNNNAFVVAAGSPANAGTVATALYSELKAGENNTGSGPTWTGTTGITSTLLANGTLSKAKYGVGLAANTDGVTSFGGQTVNSSDVLIGIALLGDTDMSGTVDFTDLNNLLNHYNSANTTWQQGNFLGDPTTDFPDLNALLNNYTQSITSNDLIDCAGRPSGHSGDQLARGTWLHGRA